MQSGSASADPTDPSDPPSSRPADAEGPEVPAGPPEPGLAVAAAARRLGVAPSTLRTWDRRYGIGPTEHVAGGHRRYSPRDVACLEVMTRALTRGITPADAARYALTTRTSDPGTDPAGRLTATPAAGSPPGRDGHAATPGTAPAATPGTAPVHDLTARTTPVPAHDGRTGTRSRGGGRGLPLPGAGPRTRGLARAALALDAVAAADLLRESIDASGIEVTWNDVACPVLAAVSQRWAETGAGIEIEHMLSECVIGVFATAAAGPAQNTRPVLLAGMPGELHTLPMAVLSAALAHRQVLCRSLGADLPATSLVSAMRRTAPVAVVLWSQVTTTADPEMVRALPRTRPAARTFVAGPGWAGADLPERVIRLDTLGGAVDALSGVAGPTAGRR